MEEGTRRAGGRRADSLSVCSRDARDEDQREESCRECVLAGASRSAALMPFLPSYFRSTHPAENWLAQTRMAPSSSPGPTSSGDATPVSGSPAGQKRRSGCNRAGWQTKVAYGRGCSLVVVCPDFQRAPALAQTSLARPGLGDHHETSTEIPSHCLHAACVERDLAVFPGLHQGSIPSKVPCRKVSCPPMTAILRIQCPESLARLPVHVLFWRCAACALCAVRCACGARLVGCFLQVVPSPPHGRILYTRLRSPSPEETLAARDPF